MELPEQEAKNIIFEKLIKLAERFPFEYNDYNEYEEDIEDYKKNIIYEEKNEDNKNEVIIDDKHWCWMHL